jgi:hypothetical protein
MHGAKSLSLSIYCSNRSQNLCIGGDVENESNLWKLQPFEDQLRGFPEANHGATPYLGTRVNLANAR